MTATAKQQMTGYDECDNDGDVDDYDVDGGGGSEVTTFVTCVFFLHCFCSISVTVFPTYSNTLNTFISRILFTIRRDYYENHMSTLDDIEYRKN